MSVAGVAGLVATELQLLFAGAAGFFLFGAILVFRIWAYLVGMRPAAEALEWEPERPDDWPVYTLLIGLKDEADTAPKLAATLPVYWQQQPIAMVRAPYGLAKCPHFLAKTPHIVHG